MGRGSGSGAIKVRRSHFWSQSHFSSIYSFTEGEIKSEIVSLLWPRSLDPVNFRGEGGGSCCRANMFVIELTKQFKYIVLKDYSDIGSLEYCFSWKQIFIIFLTRIYCLKILNQFSRVARPVCFLSNV